MVLFTLNAVRRKLITIFTDMVQLADPIHAHCRGVALSFAVEIIHQSNKALSKSNFSRYIRSTFLDKNNPQQPKICGCTNNVSDSVAFTSTDNNNSKNNIDNNSANATIFKPPVFTSVDEGITLLAKSSPVAPGRIISLLSKSATKQLITAISEGINTLITISKSSIVSSVPSLIVSARGHEIDIPSTHGRRILSNKSIFILVGCALIILALFSGIIQNGEAQVCLAMLFVCTNLSVWIIYDMVTLWGNRIDVGAVAVTSLVSNERTDSVESLANTFSSFIACTQSPIRAEPIVALNAVEYPANGTSRLDKFAWQMRIVEFVRRLTSVSVSDAVSFVDNLIKKYETRTAAVHPHDLLSTHAPVLDDADADAVESTATATAAPSIVNLVAMAVSSSSLVANKRVDSTSIVTSNAIEYQASTSSLNGLAWQIVNVGKFRVASDRSVSEATSCVNRLIKIHGTDTATESLIDDLFTDNDLPPTEDAPVMGNDASAATPSINVVAGPVSTSLVPNKRADSAPIMPNAIENQASSMSNRLDKLAWLMRTVRLVRCHTPNLSVSAATLFASNLMEIFEAHEAAVSIVDSLDDVDIVESALAADDGGADNDGTDYHNLPSIHATQPRTAVDSTTMPMDTLDMAEKIFTITPLTMTSLDIDAQSPTTTLDRPITILIGLLRSVSSLLAILPFINSIMMMFTFGNALMAGVSTKTSIALPDNDMPPSQESSSTTEVNINVVATTQTLRAHSSLSLYQICIETLLITILVPLIVVIAFILMMALVSRPDPISTAIQAFVVCYSAAVARLLTKMMGALKASLHLLITSAMQRLTYVCSDLYESFFIILSYTIFMPLIGVPFTVMMLIATNACCSFGLVLSTLMIIIPCISTSLRDCVHHITCRIANRVVYQIAYDSFRLANTLLWPCNCSISIGLALLCLIGAPEGLMDCLHRISQGIDMVESTLFYQIGQRRSQVLHVPIWEMLKLILAVVGSVMTVILRILKSCYLSIQSLHARGLNTFQTMLLAPLVAIITGVLVIPLSIGYQYKGRKSSAAMDDLVVAASSSYIVVYTIMKLISASSYLIQVFIVAAIRAKIVAIVCITVVRWAVRVGWCILEHLSALESSSMTAVRIIITSNLCASLHIARFTLRALYTIIIMCIECIRLCVATAMRMRSKLAVPIDSKAEQSPPTLVAMSDDDELSNLSDDDSVTTFDSGCANHTDIVPPLVARTRHYYKKPHPPAELFDWHRRRGGRLRPKKRRYSRSW